MNLTSTVKKASWFFGLFEKISVPITKGRDYLKKDSLLIDTMYHTLAYDFLLGIEEDILKSPQQRLQYQPYIVLAQEAGVKPEHIPSAVLAVLYYKKQKPWYKFWKK